MERKRNDLTLKEKVEILQLYDNLPKMSQRNAAVKLKVSQPLLCKLLKNREDIENKCTLNENPNAKRNRCGKDKEVESALKLWFTNVRERDARVDGPLLRQKAEDLAAKLGKENFVATEGWFQRWKKRQNVVYRRMHGEQRDADQPAADQWILEEWPKLIEMYSPDDVFNADETGLYFRALPEHTYLFQNESTKGCRSSKERITVLCCVNMTGKKEKLLVIGKSKNPRCLKGVKNLPVDYYANKTAWMSSTIFNEWLSKWDRQLKRNILLLIDNCTAHVKTVQLKHIKIVFLPANTTSLLQPCDQGVIRTLKAYYRKEMRSRILENMEDTTNKLSGSNLAKKINVLDAIHLLAMAWNEVSEKTIRNCFSHGGFLQPEEDANAVVEQLEKIFSAPPDMTVQDFEAWMDIDENLETSAVLTDHDICEAVTNTNEISTSVSDEDEPENVIEEEKTPTSAEMRNALRILRLGVQRKAEADGFRKHYEYERFINELLRKQTKQSTIGDFFAP